RCKRLLPFSALSACSCSLALSGPGEPLTLGCPLNPTHLRWGCCMHYCGAPDAGGSRLDALVRCGVGSLLPSGAPARPVAEGSGTLATRLAGPHAPELSRHPPGGAREGSRA